MSRSSKCEQTQNSCQWCAEHPFDVCRACARLGRAATRLLDTGRLSPEQVAEMLGLEVARMQRLAEEERQLRDLQQYKRDRIPLAPIQALFARRQEEDPSLSKTRAAELAEYNSRVEFLRTMGFVRTASFVRKGKRYPGKHRTEISVEAAGRIVRAIGYAPREVRDLCPKPSRGRSRAAAGRASRLSQGRVTGAWSPDGCWSDDAPSR